MRPKMHDMTLSLLKMFLKWNYWQEAGSASVFFSQVAPILNNLSKTVIWGWSPLIFPLAKNTGDSWSPPSVSHLRATQEFPTSLSGQYSKWICQTMLFILPRPRSYLIYLSQPYKEFCLLPSQPISHCLIELNIKCCNYILTAATTTVYEVSVLVSLPVAVIKYSE